jgi:exodeoxyribonuclease VII small subunit
MASDLFGGAEEGKVDQPKQQQGAMARGSAVKATPDNAAPKPAPVPAKAEAGGMRFEEAFARLETLVGEMERGELPLETMLDRFEEGVRLVRQCNDFLGQAQLRVEQYVEQKDGHWVLKELK